MGVVQLPDALKQVIDRQVSQGRAASEADFLTEAIQRYAEALESAEVEVLAGADDGIADSEAGRYQVIADKEIWIGSWRIFGQAVRATPGWAGDWTSEGS